MLALPFLLGLASSSLPACFLLVAFGLDSFCMFACLPACSLDCLIACSRACACLLVIAFVYFHLKADASAADLPSSMIPDRSFGSFGNRYPSYGKPTFQGHFGGRMSDSGRLSQGTLECHFGFFKETSRLVLRILRISLSIVSCQSLSIVSCHCQLSVSVVSRPRRK